MRSRLTAKALHGMAIILVITFHSFLIGCGNCDVNSDCENGYRCVHYQPGAISGNSFCVNDFTSIRAKGKSVIVGGTSTTFEKNFRILTNEVTVADYAVCADGDDNNNEKGALCSKAGGGEHCFDGGEWTKSPYLPVNCVNWQQAEEYCKATYFGGRLCKESEWAFAAGGGVRPYPWGDDAPTCELVQFNGPCKPFIKEYGIDTTVAPVGVWDLEDGMTPDGVRNMAGNVAEWVQNDAAGGNKVIRGGSYNSTADEIKTTARASAAPTSQLPEIGFRCCMDGE